MTPLSLLECELHRQVDWLFQLLDVIAYFFFIDAQEVAVWLTLFLL